MVKKIKGQGMERIGIDVDDPIFGEGTPQAYIAPITVSPPGLACQAELYLGPNDTTKVATSGLVSFNSTGVIQNIRLPIIMPTAAGVAYHGYIDVYADGMIIGGYILLEDVVIPSVEVGPGTWE